MSIIKVENLCTSFGKNIIHNNISFDVNEGEIFGVLGGSGSGKTVLVKQLVMLNPIQKGSVKIFDKDITNLSIDEIDKLKLDFSYLFQFGALYSFLNVIENISVMLKEYTNLPKDLIEKIAYTNLDIVGLPKRVATLYPNELSGGMKKRVAFARSLAMQPKILFLDEPTSGLDPASTDQINELLLYLKKHLNITTVIITHDLETIKTVLDRFIIIKKEKIFDGTINEALKSGDSFIQDFLSIKRVS
ncbi:sulfate ABC transporter ATP-binding protein [Aliarcobacter skirrowii]|uniref:Lipid asymmetry ABC transporter MlaABCDEF, ATPase component MlaF n=1 Tax=Aliarcobacter skirrowii CCUG 10374 TaxID=1032239 RepID=A0AAD0WMN0_9BACT|nr:ATP-binding cassette domain-containing protein [Aliarcobacter skirrowii]AXX83936.1 lipid asymmetry ABC transporter MlaABCDEF, ATPase component MlaF [Aliarcobacter skirrowii CCUG 10374]KAB0621870.1 ATP-binding cassette domain-containing protein [Aliarcobacter skirrowii CCUG 10374]RXI27122.1 sulfate ABC transporter ATP-binding protein [Aliarcobacter skirrowii CCUG 10374]RXJ78382.1 sulfate ABC transporter ATP-binding protein [Aliarcobacter skirrowii]SUU95570.1 Methionine import ATP-binding pro